MLPEAMTNTSRILPICPTVSYTPHSSVTGCVFVIHPTIVHFLNIILSLTVVPGPVFGIRLFPVGFFLVDKVTL